MNDERKSGHIFCENFGRDIRLVCFGFNDFANMKSYKLWRKGEENSLHLVLKGRGTLAIGNREYRIEEKHAFCIFKNTLCKYYPDEDNPWAYVWFNFTGEQDAELIRHAGFTAENPVRPCDRFYEIESELHEKVETFENGDIRYMAVLGLLYRLVDILSESGRTSTTKQSNALVVQMKKNMETYYVDPNFNVALLYKMMYLSDGYAYRLFKREEGISPKQYLVRKRMHAAKEMLRETDSSVKEIARVCGYGDYDHFIKEFKSYNGTTPGRYRRTASRGTEGQAVAL